MTFNFKFVLFVHKNVIIQIQKIHSIAAIENAAKHILKEFTAETVDFSPLNAYLPCLHACSLYSGPITDTD